ncbi:MAG: N-acyl homoserine lactonase family protein [Nitratireductor sp.]|nr:N-acyl homoserine lactonase family protein [Nitratireductor sp.]MCB1458079.1 N-acyl homoserine lactonase family protein [Nitratireductor sp.]
MTANDHYEVLAIRYAERNNRIRADSFIFTDDHTSSHPMDYFVWLIRNETRTILVDTGYDATEAAQRGRPILVEPVEALADIGITPEMIDSIIVTHLHYDHAGGLAQFPQARLHLQEAEMAYATGPCMCHGTLRMPFTADHVCETVKRVYAGKVTFHDGTSQIAPGITVHRIGGHSRGLQCVRVETANGPVVLASDASHYYENYQRKVPFPLVVDVEDMLKGFDQLERLAGPGGRIIPGHDPLVRAKYPRAFEGSRADVRRLDL